MTPTGNIMGCELDYLKAEAEQDLHLSLLLLDDADDRLQAYDYHTFFMERMVEARKTFIAHLKTLQLFGIASR